MKRCYWGNKHIKKWICRGIPLWKCLRLIKWSWHKITSKEWIPLRKSLRLWYKITRKKWHISREVQTRIQWSARSLATKVYLKLIKKKKTSKEILWMLRILKKIQKNKLLRFRMVKLNKINFRLVIFLRL